MGEGEPKLGEDESKSGRAWAKSGRGFSRVLSFVFLDFVNEAAIMEQYGNEASLAALEWCGVSDTDVPPGKSDSLIWLAS